MQVTPQDVEALALGGAFLATGGGGDTLIGEIVAEDALRRFGPIDLIALSSLQDSDLVVALGAVGSPTIMQEKPSNGREPLMALEALEKHLGRKADAVIAFEAGGVNGLLPLCVAAERGLPVVDADGMGRAFPELQMESFSIYGVTATPLAASTELGELLILDNAPNPAVAEKVLRNFAVVAGGGQCTSAEHSMSGEVAKEVAIEATISLSIDIGRLILQHGNDLSSLIPAIRERFQPTHYGAVRELYSGKVTDIARQTRGGYDFGELKLEPLTGSRQPMTISIKNEYLIAFEGEVPKTLTPDLIILLDQATGRPVTAETLRYGQRVTVLGIGAPARMRTEKALQVVAPPNFGFEMPYTPLEKLLPEA